MKRATLSPIHSQSHSSSCGPIKLFMSFCFPLLILCVPYVTTLSLPLSSSSSALGLQRRFIDTTGEALSDTEALWNWAQKHVNTNTNTFVGDNYDELSQEFQEPKCPKGKWWHLRGRRCVPDKCLGGNRMRNIDTGECIRKSGRRYNKSPVFFFTRSTLRRFNSPHRYYRGMMGKRSG